MEGDQWPPPLTPMINQDPSSSFLYSTNGSIPATSSMSNGLLHPLSSQMMGDPEIDWVNLLSQAGCSTSSSTATNNHQDLFLPPSSSSLRLIGGEDQGRNKSLDDVRKVGRKVKKVVPPRVAFHTRSQDDILDDGYKWRKYGQKAVKNCNYPRSYYHCTRHTCNVKKQIQRLSKDPGIVVTTYEGIHNHPCEQFMETLSPLLNQIQFLTKF
uniref:WRKY domain-containing protein n=1 Tax=Kalanchoe fedtschenkoi TaxID=63787 RepID=A0A7N0U103_KALFE